MLCNIDESNHIALLREAALVRPSHRYSNNILFLPTGATVAVQREDGGTRTHGIIIGHGTDDHNCRS